MTTGRSYFGPPTAEANDKSSLIDRSYEASSLPRTKSGCCEWRRAFGVEEASTTVPNLTVVASTRKEAQAKAS